MYNKSKCIYIERAKLNLETWNAFSIQNNHLLSKGIQNKFQFNISAFLGLSWEVSIDMNTKVIRTILNSWQGLSLLLELSINFYKKMIYSYYFDPSDTTKSKSWEKA